MNEEIKVLVQALRKAVKEAEGWYDESRGLDEGERIDGLEDCYALLDKYKEDVLGKGDKFTIAGVRRRKDGTLTTRCKPGNETQFVAG